MNVLEKIIRGVGSFHERKDPSKPHINLYEDRIEVADVSFTWDEICVVEAYKIDLGTTDEVRIQVGFGSPEKAIVLSEEQEHFDAFIHAAELRLCFHEGWWDRLVRPAFKVCDVTLFRRESQRLLWARCGQSERIATSSDWQHAKLVRTAGFGQKRIYWTVKFYLLKE